MPHSVNCENDLLRETSYRREAHVRSVDIFCIARVFLCLNWRQARRTAKPSSHGVTQCLQSLCPVMGNAACLNAYQVRRQDDVVGCCRGLPELLLQRHAAVLIDAVDKRNSL